MRTIFGFLTLMISVMFVVVSLSFDAEGANILWATLALATAMVAAGLLLDSADQLLAEPQQKPRDAG